jgi:hypothetical protein
MLAYGRTLMQHNPEDTTELLIELCTGTLGKPKLLSTSIGNEVAKSNGSGPAVLSYLGYNRVAGMFNSDAQASTVPESRATNDKSGSRILPDKKVSGGGALPATIEVDPEPIPSYTPPSPRIYFAHFIDHHDLFVRFLEAVALALWKQKVDASLMASSRPPPYDASDRQSKSIEEDQEAVWNTLLELYLDSTSSSQPETALLARSKALGLLSSDLPHDSMHSLLLCSTAGFTDGMVRLWENMGMYEDVLRFWMTAPTPLEGPHPSDQVLRCLNLYGPTNPHLYPLVLRYLTSSSEVLARQSGQLAHILNQIDEGRIMPPLAVVQLLSRNGVASIGNVKEWLRSKVAEARQDADSVSLPAADRLTI